MKFNKPGETFAVEAGMLFHDGNDTFMLISGWTLVRLRDGYYRPMVSLDTILDRLNAQGFKYLGKLTEDSLEEDYLEQ